jgi:hypothetical protein
MSVKKHFFISSSSIFSYIYQMITFEILVSWSLYYFLHSLLASFFMKSLIDKISPALNKYYRIFYNVFSVLLLLLLYIRAESFEKISCLKKLLFQLQLPLFYLFPEFLFCINHLRITINVSFWVCQ